MIGRNRAVSVMINRTARHRVVGFRTPGFLGGWKHLALGLTLVQHLRHVAEQQERPLPRLAWLFACLNCQLLLRPCNISFSSGCVTFELCLWPSWVAECAAFPSLMHKFWGSSEPTSVHRGLLLKSSFQLEWRSGPKQFFFGCNDVSRQCHPTWSIYIYWQSY